MKRWLLKLLPFLAGVVTGAGGMFGFQYQYGADAPTILQRLQGEGATAAADSAAPVATAPADSLPPVAVDTAAPAIDPLTLLPVDTAAAPAPPADTATPEVDLIPTRRLAKFFGSMQAREAARVLEKMTDTEVEIILSQLGDREAATILSSLTPERAAQISQVVISGERSAP